MARLHIDALEECANLWQILDTLEALPSSLHDRYTKILDRIPLNHRKLIQDALPWVAFSAVPLTIDDLRYVLAVSKSNDEINEAELMPADLMLQFRVLTLVRLGLSPGSLFIPVPEHVPYKELFGFSSSLSSSPFRSSLSSRFPFRLSFFSFFCPLPSDVVFVFMSSSSLSSLFLSCHLRSPLSDSLDVTMRSHESPCNYRCRCFFLASCLGSFFCISMLYTYFRPFFEFISYRFFCLCRSLVRVTV